MCSRQQIWISLNFGEIRCRLTFVALVHLHKVSQNENIKPNFLRNWSCSDLPLNFMEAVSKVQQVVYWSLLKDLKFRNHHPRLKRKIFMVTQARKSVIYTECIQTLQAGVRKLILDTMYFLFTKILLWDFLCIIIQINKIQTLLALLELSIAVVFC